MPFKKRPRDNGERGCPKGRFHRPRGRPFLSLLTEVLLHDGGAVPPMAGRFWDSSPLRFSRAGR